MEEVWLQVFIFQIGKSWESQGFQAPLLYLIRKFASEKHISMNHRLNNKNVSEKRIEFNSDGMPFGLSV